MLNVAQQLGQCSLIKPSRSFTYCQNTITQEVLINNDAECVVLNDTSFDKQRNFFLVLFLPRFPLFGDQGFSFGLDAAKVPLRAEALFLSVADDVS